MSDSSSPYLIKADRAFRAHHTPGGEIARFEGADHGFPGMTLMVSKSPPGAGAPEHMHPAEEIYILVEGRGTYTIDGKDVAAQVGDVVIVPPNTRHSFRADRDSVLRHVVVYAGDRLVMLPAAR